MDVGWNFRREHLRLQQRSHNVITNGADQPDVVPPTASVWYYFREIDYPPHWTDADQTFARALQHELKVSEVGLSTELRPLGESVPDDRNMGGDPTTSDDPSCGPFRQ